MVRFHIPVRQNKTTIAALPNTADEHNNLPQLKSLAMDFTESHRAMARDSRKKGGGGNGKTRCQSSRTDIRRNPATEAAKINNNQQYSYQVREHYEAITYLFSAAPKTIGRGTEVNNAIAIGGGAVLPWCALPP